MNNDWIAEIILKWAKEQEAIDKFGEITLVPQTNDLEEIAQAIREEMLKTLQLYKK